jgi:hypothetical protein
MWVSQELFSERGEMETNRNYIKTYKRKEYNMKKSTRKLDAKT